MASIAETGSGRVSGERTEDGAVLTFKGIPYAAPPLGLLRWQPPRACEKWSGIRSASAYGAACIQPSVPENSLVYGSERYFSEDCLYLNVYTGSVDPQERRPVIVWLHHGGFMMGWSGAPLYDGVALARAGAVIVTVNYRLGRLGFLAHPALSAESPFGSSGNYGLQDQIAALAWVRENIAGFGGDPDCVTLYGVSAGCFSVSALLASPLAKGLFHRAIGGSGGAFGPVAETSEVGDFLQPLAAAEASGMKVMAAVGASTTEELRALSAETILSAKMPEFWRARRGLLDTQYPIIDGRVLPAAPREVFERGQHHDMPMLLGSNRNEASIVPFNEDTDTYVADNMALWGPLAERFFQLFPPGAAGKTAHASMEANADRLFSWQIWRWVRLQAAHGVQPVYHYLFAHEPPVLPGVAAEQQWTPHVGAFHSAEIPYVFRNLAVRNWPWSPEDRELSNTISEYWLAFARSGNPNGGTRPRWPAFNNIGSQRLRFERGASAEIAVPSERMSFWDDAYAGFLHRQQAS